MVNTLCAPDRGGARNHQRRKGGFEYRSGLTFPLAQGSSVSRYISRYRETRMPVKDLVYVKEKPGMGLGIFAVRDI